MGESLKKLVVFYSFEGNTRFVAEQIAVEAGADLLEIRPKKETKTHGFMKYFWGGRQSVMKVKPELEQLTRDPGGYDLLFIGTPVWAFNFSPPLRSFLEIINLSGKKIALFCCDEGGLGKTFVNLREILKDNRILGEKEFQAPLRKSREEVAGKAKEWARQMVNEADKATTVVVPDYQLSLAIGKRGQNARLAAKLTGWKIDIKSETDARELGIFPREDSIKLFEDDADLDYDFEDELE
jgi:flavodoxin